MSEDKPKTAEARPKPEPTGMVFLAASAERPPPEPTGPVSLAKESRSQEVATDDGRKTTED